MKPLLPILSILVTVTSFAATDAQIVGAVFNDQKFISLMGESKLDDIEISETSQKKYSVIVNSRAPMVDGCSYLASVSEASERFAINPTTTGIRTVLKVTGAKAKCRQTKKLKTTQ